MTEAQFQIFTALFNGMATTLKNIEENTRIIKDRTANLDLDFDKKTNDSIQKEMAKFIDEHNKTTDQNAGINWCPACGENVYVDSMGYCKKKHDVKMLNARSKEKGDI